MFYVYLSIYNDVNAIVSITNGFYLLWWTLNMIFLGKVSCYKSFQVIAGQIWEFSSAQSIINVNKHTLIYKYLFAVSTWCVCETVNGYKYTYAYHYQHNIICIYLPFVLGN